MTQIMAGIDRDRQDDRGRAIVALTADRRPETRALSQAAVLDFLQQAEPDMKRVDTHASILFLGRERVLKIKRAVRLPYLDYSTLDRRHRACEDELLINRTYAPQLYRGVTPITRVAGGFKIGGDGDPVEWAVEMARFDETRSFDQLAARQPIDPELAIGLAQAIVSAHARQKSVPDSGWVRSIGGIIGQNTARFRSVSGLAQPDVDRLDARSRAALRDHLGLLQERSDAGFVHRCHGDLHLGNIVLIDDQPVLFDAIEFDPAIATTDILYDLAFPLMDLIRYGSTIAANALFNRYLAGSADANRDALALLPLLLSMRAAIRANVLFTKAEQTDGDRTAVWTDAKRYFDLAIDLIHPKPRCMVAVGGLSGTGKSVLARGIAPLLGAQPGAVVLRSDVIRKNLFGASETERLPESAYTPAVTAQVYEELRSGARRVARQGHAVVLDAAFLRDDERAAFSTLAPAELAHIGLFLTADRAVRIARIENRRNDASDATAAVTVQQEAYSPAEIDWPLIDAGGTAAETLAQACRYLPLRQAPATP